jgi:hypothetical protein
MPDSHFRATGPSLWMIERPNCPNCTTRMNPARVMPNSNGHDVRTFECNKCDHILTLTLAGDPMNADSANSINDALKSPK